MRRDLAGTDGCLVAVGTGSFFFCSQLIRVTRSIGGWGFAAGDNGSGAQLGQDFLRLVLQYNDGLAPHSDWTRAVLLEFGNIAAQLAAFAQRASQCDFGHYALKVVSAAEAGNTQALTLCQNTVQAIQNGLDAIGFICQR